MSTAIIIIGFIVLFIGTLTLVQFPEIATEIYVTLSGFIGYLGDASGILWFFLPKSLTIVVLELVIAIELVIRTILIFLWIYNHLYK